MKKKLSDQLSEKIIINSLLKKLNFNKKGTFNFENDAAYFSAAKNYKTIINGDEKIKVISAASIVAKVYRDKLMIKLAKEFSNYAWESNFGYGTKAHLEGLKKFGITSHHRKSFKPVHKILSN